LSDHLMGGQGAQATLEELERRSMFTTRVDSRRGWFRYHTLLRAFLRTTMLEQHRDEAKALLTRAAEWHLSRDDHDLGVTYLADAEAWDSLADAVVRLGAGFASNDRAAMTAAWLSKVPREVVRARRDVGLLDAASAVFAGAAGDPGPALDELSDDPGTTPTEQVIVSLLRAHRALRNGSYDTALSEARAAIAGIDHVDEDTLPSLFGLTGSRDDVLAGARLASGLALMYRGDDVDARFQLAPVASSHVGWQAATLSGLSLLDAWCGSLRSGERLARRSLSMAAELGSDRQPVAHARIALARVACDRGRLEEADEVLERVTSGLGATPLPAIEPLVRIGRAEVAAARGDAEGALRMLTMPAGQLSIEPPLVAARRAALEAQLLLATGDRRGARRVIDESVVTGYELDAARVRLAVDEGDLTRAHVLLERMPDRPEPRAPLARVLWSAVLDWLEGKATASHVALTTVVASAEPEGDLALFRGAGTLALTPTRALFRSAPTPFVRTVIESLAAMASARPRVTRQLVEQLTEREYKVLTLLPTRLSSAEIADRLGISLNTVKTHLKHLYRKLGVSGRNDAVAAAERLHLL
jgi:LuxR family maltose regulon positive regulatory protein